MSEFPTSSHSMSHMRSSSTSLMDATVNLGNEDELSKVKIYSDLTQYEEVLAELVASVDNFKPDVKIAKRLIQVDKDLYESVKAFTQYDQIDRELRRLEKESNDLDQRTRNILETLNDCYNNLNALPTLEQVEFERQTILEQRKKINSSVLLEYGTKLSKFTKIPPTLDRGATGPNNFIWPAEDALRRGMLALASLHSKEITRIPGEPEDVSEASQPVTQEEPIQQESPEQSQAVHLQKRNSYVHSEDTATEQNDDEMDLDLDIFNPDEF
ncbi:hypothetical protein HG536_0H04160 [Torulaspora globosa]|uniref:Mediator of RNA polymerase II transcription subunit 4 n=1 Tax=Torulaspora globosa TaxID=48254 RepID=A0A7G3ZNF4_9SACH|nr:uncharacterized protein HG536_0H04160 [Torulaspora globosa]QLL35040.1 hypothetical protein HG536_0H04160 [Torulaspora globosa]